MEALADSIVRLVNELTDERVSGARKSMARERLYQIAEELRDAGYIVAPKM